MPGVYIGVPCVIPTEGFGTFSGSYPIKCDMQPTEDISHQRDFELAMFWRMDLRWRDLQRVVPTRRGLERENVVPWAARDWTYLQSFPPEGFGTSSQAGKVASYMLYFLSEGFGTRLNPHQRKKVQALHRIFPIRGFWNMAQIADIQTRLLTLASLTLRRRSFESRGFRKLYYSSLDIIERKSKPEHKEGIIQEHATDIALFEEFNIRRI